MDPFIRPFDFTYLVNPAFDSGWFACRNYACPLYD
jgi:hypothetical protein